MQRAGNSGYLARFLREVGIPQTFPPGPEFASQDRWTSHIWPKKRPDMGHPTWLLGLETDQNIFAFNSYGINCNRFIRFRGGARGRIEGPGVPGADDFARFN